MSIEGLVTRIMHAKYQCSIINTSEDMRKVNVFVTDGQTDGQMSFNVPRFCERRGDKKSRYHVKGRDTRNTYMQYESTTSSGLKVIAKVKVFVHAANANARAMKQAP